MKTDCPECSDKAKLLVNRNKRVEWGVKQLRGQPLPVETETLEVVTANIDHILWIAAQRAAGRGLEWGTLGINDKIDVVESLIDMWPAKSAGEA